MKINIWTCFGESEIRPANYQQQPLHPCCLPVQISSWKVLKDECSVVAWRPNTFPASVQWCSQLHQQWPRRGRRQAQLTSPCNFSFKHIIDSSEISCADQIWSADTILKSAGPHFHLSREFDCWSKAKPGNFKSHGHWPTNLPIIDWCWLCYIRMVWLGRRWMRSSPSSSRLLLLPEKNSRTSRCQSSLLPPPLQLRHTSSSFSCHSVFVTFLSFISFVTSSS